MTEATAILIWWTAGWGGWLNSAMLAAFRGCSERGARDVLSAAADRGWLRRHYLNNRRVIYQITTAARIMAEGVLGRRDIRRADNFRARSVDGKFVPPGGWLHASNAAIAAAQVARFFDPNGVDGYHVIPMCYLPQVEGEKTPDALIFIGHEYVALEYERSRKTGHEKRWHSTWETLERYIADVSCGEVEFSGGRVGQVVVAPHDQCVDELERHIDRQCTALARKRAHVIHWGWFRNGVIDWRSTAPAPSEP